MKLQKEKGITLIALIVTIIILIILAGISISTLTGDNGIIDQAHTAKEDTEIASWEEQIDLAIIDAEKKHRDTTMENVIEELINKKVINDESQVDKDTGTITTNEPSYVLEDKLADYVIKIPTLAEITGSETENTIAKDNLGNKIKIPAGFKVVNPEETVENGIIIEDVSYEATKGSQFVWIPIGTINTNKGNKTINFGRYPLTYSGSEDFNSKYKEETVEEHTNQNMPAKDINGFKSSVEKNKGYYIGRYEARTDVKRTEEEKNTLTQLTEKQDDYVYNYVSQINAANLSRNMYNNSNFESDLINSYAWDTATIFIQECSTKSNYSKQESLNSEFAEKGTARTETEDQVCNIYDMASNCYEATTETSYPYNYFTVQRGGKFGTTQEMADRSGYPPTAAYDDTSFRPILYLN